MSVHHLPADTIVRDLGNPAFGTLHGNSILVTRTFGKRPAQRRVNLVSVNGRAGGLIAVARLRQLPGPHLGQAMPRDHAGCLRHGSARFA